MVQRFALKGADRFAESGAGREQQGSAGGGMRTEDGKQGALVVVRKVKEAVPSDQPVEGAVDRQRAHIGHHPLRLRKAAPAGGDERGRGIDTNNTKPVLEQMAGNGLARAAADVQHRATRGKQRDKSRHPLLLEGQLGSTVTIPRGRVSLVQPDDLPGP